MRFTETDFANNSSQFDFVPRERRGQISNIVIAFVGSICLIFAMSLLPGFSGTGNMFYTLVVMVVISVLCFYVVYRKQQSLDLVMSTEYQNMLFAQAASLGSSFCIFVRRDGTIVYADEGLRKLFPHFAYSDSQMLEGVFELGGVQKPDRERIMTAIHNLHADRIVFPLRPPGEAVTDYILTVEPLKRPGNFLLLRGRQYRDQRAGMQLMPDILRSTSADKLDHMLATTPIAHYTADEYGRFEYVNPAMEQMLGYKGGEITDSKLSVRHILYQLNGHPVGDDYVAAEHNGPALLQKKDSSLIEVMMAQIPVRNETGNGIGFSGTLMPVGKAQ